MVAALNLSWLLAYISIEAFCTKIVPNHLNPSDYQDPPATTSTHQQPMILNTPLSLVYTRAHQQLPATTKVYQHLSGTTSIHQGLPASIRNYQHLSGTTSTHQGLSASIRDYQYPSMTTSIHQGLPAPIRDYQHPSGTTSIHQGLPAPIRD